MSYYLSLCTCVKDEGLYIEEWLKFHLGLGVEHVWLYDNDSSDNTKEIASSFKEVEVFDSPGEVVQHPTFMRCLFEHREESRWIGFLDVDEFLVPQKTNNLKSVLSKYEKYPALCVHWYLFGSNGKETYSPEPVIERFTKRCPEVNAHVKTICNPKRTRHLVTAHKFVHDGLAVDENFMPIADGDSRPPKGTCDTIAVHHYVTKSHEENALRRSRLRADIRQMRDPEPFFEGHDRNEVEDLRALKLWNAIK